MAMSHEHCTHPRTPAGRAACRKAGGPATTPDYVAEHINKTVANAKVKAKIDRRYSGGAAPCTRVTLADLPGLFRTAVDWGRANGCVETVEARKDQTLVHLTREGVGVLTLTWRTGEPGVNAVSFRPVGTSVTRKLPNVNEGLALLKK